MVSKTQRKKILNKLEAWASQLKPNEIINIILYGASAYYGYTAVPKEATTSTKIAGSIFALTSLKLATSNNIVAGASGIVGLAGIGLANATGGDLLRAIDPFAAWNDTAKLIEELAQRKYVMPTP